MKRSTLSPKTQEVADFVDRLAGRREKYIKHHRQYYSNLLRFLENNIPAGGSVLEIGCGTGHVLHAMKPSVGVGVDVSPNMIKTARSLYPDLTFVNGDIQSVDLKKKFDYIIISDTLGYLENIQNVFRNMRRFTHGGTRIFITFHNYLWQPVLRVAELFRLKMPQRRLNWLNRGAVCNLLHLEDYEIIKTGKFLLFPFFFPLLSWIFNRILAHLPLLNRVCLINYVAARPLPSPAYPSRPLSVSVIIPARNEKGNIRAALKRMPFMGKKTEIIFIEGHSTDGTYDEIRRVCDGYKGKFTLQYAKQDGKGKFDAVKKGFAMATGDLLMILDADLTVPPEELPKFYEVIDSGKAEYVQGSRLVYPLEKQAMRTLNILGNKAFSRILSWLLGQKLTDTLCGTKVLTKTNWEKICSNRQRFRTLDPFGDFDIIYGVAKHNLKILEIPIRYQARGYGATNIMRFRHGWMLLKMVFFSMGKTKFT